MAKGRKSRIDRVLDRAGDVGGDLLGITRTLLTGKKKKKSSTRKLAESNARAIEALALKLDQYARRDQAQ
ncbi:hypothetical protein [Streptomyces sp. NPDC057107]|uniref:hypothetical protein n=1 Tax=Streptomyces sp. NPDC057107 TaxID=3346021 RepID=UPI003625CA08